MWYKSILLQDLEVLKEGKARIDANIGAYAWDLGTQQDGKILKLVEKIAKVI